MERGDNEMEKISYKEFIKELNFPCVVILDREGKCETKEVVNQNNTEKIKEYKRATEEKDLVFTIIPLPPKDKIFKTEKGNYTIDSGIMYNGSKKEKFTAPKRSIDEMMKKTEPPYLIFKRSKEDVKFLDELKNKDKTKFKRCKIKSKEKKETFYIFPKKILSPFYFYRIKEDQITGHIFASGVVLGGCLHTRMFHLPLEEIRKKKEYKKKN